MTHADELMTVGDAAKVLETTVDVVHSLIRRGDLRPIKLPGQTGQRPRRLYLLRSEVMPLSAGAWRRYKPRASKEPEQ